MVVRLKILIKMALRNLRRNLRRTLLTMSTIAFGLAIVLWLDCILAGRSKSMIEKITSGRTGHIQLHRRDYLQDKFISQSFQLPVEILKEKLPEKTTFATRLYLPSMVSTGEQSTTIHLIGIDPEKEPQVTKINETLKEGHFLTPESDPSCPSRQIIIGKSLAELLKVKVGNKIVLMTQASDNTIGNDLFRITGIFSSGSADLDKSIAYSSLNCVAKLGVLTGIHEVAIKIPDPKFIGEFTQKLSDSFANVGAVGAAGTAEASLQATTWEDSMPSVSSLLHANEALVSMISRILFVVISLGIVNVLLIGVFERLREFGVMIALGTTPGQLKSVVIFESFFLALGSSIVGTILGTLVILYHMKFGYDISGFWGDKGGAIVDQVQMDFLIFPSLKFISYLKSVSATFMFVIAAALYPAFRASRLKPIEAMRAL